MGRAADAGTFGRLTRFPLLKIGSQAARLLAEEVSLENLERSLGARARAVKMLVGRRF